MTTVTRTYGGAPSAHPDTALVLPLLLFVAFLLAGCGSGGADEANVAPVASPPKIESQPLSQTIKARDPVTFSVTASSNTPASYQWRRDGVNVAGATGSTISLSPAQITDTNSVWSVIVSNASGSVTSAGATLTVQPKPGISLLAGTAGVTGNADGALATARFSNPQGIAVDATGNVFLADTGNQTIRKITPQGAVTTLAGTAGSSGIANGVGGAARFVAPSRMTIDKSGNLFVVDAGTVRRITPTGAVTTVVSNEFLPGTLVPNQTHPGLAMDPNGNLFFTTGTKIYKTPPQGETTVFGDLNMHPITALAFHPNGSLFVSNRGLYSSSPGSFTGFTRVFKLNDNPADLNFQPMYEAPQYEVSKPMAYTSMVIDKAGNPLVTRQNTPYVTRFSADLKQQSVLAGNTNQTQVTLGDLPGSLGARPIDVITIDANGVLYAVTSSTVYRIDLP